MVDAYIVGVQKSGTTSLFDWLSQHPQVDAPLAAKDFPAFTKNGNVGRLESFYGDESSCVNTLKLGAEANLLYSDQGIELLVGKYPNCKIILMLRDPVERCYSAWRYARERHIDERSFEDAIKSELVGEVFPTNTHDGLQMNYIDHSRYKFQYERLLKFFPKEQVKLVDFERFSKETVCVMKEIYCFLGIDENFEFDLVRSNQTATSTRSKLINSVLHSPNRSSLYWGVMTKITTPKLRAYLRRNISEINRVRQKSANVPEPAADVVDKITRELSDDIIFYKTIFSAD